MVSPQGLRVVEGVAGGQLLLQLGHVVLASLGRIGQGGAQLLSRSGLVLGLLQLRKVSGLAVAPHVAAKHQRQAQAQGCANARQRAQIEQGAHHAAPPVGSVGSVRRKVTAAVVTLRSTTFTMGNAKAVMA